MLKAVCYARYSSDNQRTESIDAQIRAIEEYCKRKNYALVNTYIDEALTATTDNRPNFQRMITDAKTGKFNVVVIHKLDRFARDRYDSAYYKRELKNADVRLESVLEQLDDSPESVILESVLEGLAEYYSKNLARETRKGMEENALKGLHAGGRPPYGYRVNLESMKLEIDKHAAVAVRMYFEGVANGRTVAEIAEELNAMGYRTQSGRRFTRNSFDGWARNRKYIGIYTWDVKSAKDPRNRRNNHRYKPLEEQTIIPDTVPQIISPELFEKVNRMMEQRKQKPGSMKARQIYLLSGKIFCGQCNALYRGESYRNSKSSQGTVLKFYKCGGRCGNTNVRKEDIESVVVQHLVETLFTDEAISAITRRVKELYYDERRKRTDDLAPLRKELIETERKIDNWIQALGEGLLDRQMLADYIKEASSRKAVLESELARAEAISGQEILDDAVIRSYLHAKKDALFSLDEEDKKRVVQELVEKVIILPSDSIYDVRVDVTYRYFSGETTLETGKNPLPMEDRFFSGGGDGSRSEILKMTIMV